MVRKRIRRNAKVRRVIDGDTFDIDSKIMGSSRVRINGVDAPEKGRRGAAKARDYLKKMIQGQTVTLDIKAKDKYGRLIANVYKSGKSVGKRLKKRGYKA